VGEKDGFTDGVKVGLAEGENDGFPEGAKLGWAAEVRVRR
jgi:hypothetical protein